MTIEVIHMFDIHLNQRASYQCHIDKKMLECDVFKLAFYNALK